MLGELFLKRNINKIKKDIYPVKQLTKDILQDVYSLEITIYNPNSKFNQSIFRTYKYECKICFTNNTHIFIEDHTFKSLVERIKIYVNNFNFLHP